MYPPEFNNLVSRKSAAIWYVLSYVGKSLLQVAESIASADNPDPISAFVEEDH
jgi:hypothetical protein